MENKDFKKEVVRPKINNNAKPKTEKFKVNFKPKKDFTMDVLDFYNEKIKLLHIIITVIAIVLFTISSFMTFKELIGSTGHISPIATGQNFNSMVKENFFLNLVVIVAGVTPYCYLSILGLAQSVMLVRTLAVRYALGRSLLITSLVGGVIEMIGLGLCIAVGLYYCKLTSKKNKYYNHSEFGLNDLKYQFYQFKKDEKKAKEIEEEQIEKNKKIQECNIKIPYFNLIALGAIAFVIQFVGIVITLI